MRFILLSLILSSTLISLAQENVNLEISLPETEHYDLDMLTPQFHAGRRQALRALMPDNSATVFFASPEKVRSNDVNFEFHQDPDFYYLTGLKESESILVIYKDGIRIGKKIYSEILFVKDKDPSVEVWNGTRLGYKKGQEILGIDTVIPISSFRKMDLKWKKLDLISYSMPSSSVEKNEQDKTSLFKLIQQMEAKLFEVKDETLHPKENSVWMSKLREIKQEEELVFLKKAIDITLEAQKELMRALKPGMTEYQSEAIVEFIFKLYGAEYPGFPSIQGSGLNSCVLHYQTNRKSMIGANLLVSDVGAEYRGYTADVTRTLPVDGKFSEEEALIYNLVLEAQNKGIEAAVVGANFWDTHTATSTTLSQGLMKLGITKSPLELTKYFMHGTSHYLGLDVHDAGTYGTLQPNTVITVEPGIYIPTGSPCDEKWWNIGVRIEDDILITADGPVNLSGDLPREIEEIEKIMEENSSLVK